MDINVRDVPAPLWHRVRMAVVALSTPEHRLTIREAVVEALTEWLERKGF